MGEREGLVPDDSQIGNGDEQHEEDGDEGEAFLCVHGCQLSGPEGGPADFIGDGAWGLRLGDIAAARMPGR